MRINRKEMIRAIKFLLPAIGQNESRRNLMHLHVKKEGSKVVMTGADAFRIKRVKISLPEGTKRFQPFLVPRQMLVLFRQMCIQEKHHDRVVVTRSELSVDTHGIKYKQPKLVYPEIDDLMTGNRGDYNIYTENHECRPVGVNANFLTECTNAMQAYDVFKMETAGPEAPIRFTSQCGNFISILMPVRLQW